MSAKDADHYLRYNTKKCYRRGPHGVFLDCDVLDYTFGKISAWVLCRWTKRLLLRKYAVRV